MGKDHPGFFFLVSSFPIINSGKKDLIFVKVIQDPGCDFKRGTGRDMFFMEPFGHFLVKNFQCDVSLCCWSHEHGFFQSLLSL